MHLRIKNKRVNISTKELKALKLLAAHLLGPDNKAVASCPDRIYGCPASGLPSITTVCLVCPGAGPNNDS